MLLAPKGIRGPSLSGFGQNRIHSRQLACPISIIHKIIFVNYRNNSGSHAAAREMGSMLAGVVSRRLRSTKFYT